MKITHKDLKDMESELSKPVIPDGKVLLIGSKEAYEYIKREGWKGEYYYNPFIEPSTVIMMDSIKPQYKPIPYEKSNIHKQSVDKKGGKEK